MREELLKNMEDGDSLKTVLGYAKHIEGTQHSEHISKVYLDTIKISNFNVKVEATSQKCNGSNKRQNSKHMSLSKSKPKGNCGTNHPFKKCPVYGKLCYSCKKRGTLSHIVDPDRGVKGKENGSLTQCSPDMINMKLPVPTTETKMTTPTGSNMNRTLCKYFLVEVLVNSVEYTHHFKVDSGASAN